MRNSRWRDYLSQVANSKPCFASQCIRVALAMLLLLGAAVPGKTKSTSIDIFKMGETRGLKSVDVYEPANTDPRTKNEFLPFHRAFVRDGALKTFFIPPEDPPTNYRYTGIGPFPVKAMRRYTLDFRGNKILSDTETYHLLVCATYLRGGKPMWFDGYLLGVSQVFPNMPRTLQDFPTPPGAEEMILWIGVTNSPNRLVPGPKFIFTSLNITDVGPLDGVTDNRALRGVNLLPVSDFEKEPLGTYAPGTAVFRPGQGLMSEIAFDGSKCLHVVKSQSSPSVFPSFPGRPVNLDNSSTIFSFRIRGKGKIRPMIWWWMKHSNWSYYGGDTVELRDAWQTVSLWRGCTTPGVDYAACSIAIETPETEFWVDDMSLKIIPAGKAH